MPKAASTALAAALVGALVVACTPTDESDPPGPDDPAEVALTVRTVETTGRLGEDARARMETEVADVLANYVVNGFLGEYPREEFVSGFSDFTSKATEWAIRDIAQLTASRFEDASSVRATKLVARLSFLVRGNDVVGASAWVDFAFVVDDGGATTDVSLDGRFSLGHDDGEWVVFGYRVVRDDSDALPAEVSS